MPCWLLEKFPLDNFPESIASIEKQFQNKVRFWHYSCRTCFCWFLLGPANTRPWRHEPFSQNSLKCWRQNREFKNTHSTFRDCRVHFCNFFRQPFSNSLYIKREFSMFRDIKDTRISSSLSRPQFLTCTPLKCPKFVFILRRIVCH